MIVYESDWKWWSQSTNHWDGAAGKLEKGGLSSWPEYRGLTKHGNKTKTGFFDVCVCVWKRGEVFTAICPSKFGENWVLNHWMGRVGTTKTSRGGAIQFSMKNNSFFHWCPVASPKKTSMFRYLKRNITSFFFPAPWRDLQSLGTYTFCSKCLLNRHWINPQTQPLRFRSEPSPYCSQSFT